MENKYRNPLSVTDMPKIEKKAADTAEKIASEVKIFNKKHPGQTQNPGHTLNGPIAPDYDKMTFDLTHIFVELAVIKRGGFLPPKED